MRINATRERRPKTPSAIQKRCLMRVSLSTVMIRFPYKAEACVMSRYAEDCTVRGLAGCCPEGATSPHGLGRFLRYLRICHRRPEEWAWSFHLPALPFAPRRLGLSDRRWWAGAEAAVRRRGSGACRTGSVLS